MWQPESSRGERLRSESDIAALVSIPEHQLLVRIGSGSYGQVWLARSALGVYRAVKIVFRDSFDHDRPFERELSGIRKFEPVSRLHEGFVDVLQVGINEERGYFYYVMELGDDQLTSQKIEPTAYTPNTLGSEISRRGRLSLQECLQLGLALTRALAELHKHGLVHRDVKPSNVIFVNGVPKLADIGLVTEIRDTRSYVGTEGFIPPEGPGSPQADLFSLGMVLYEASTGRDRNDFPEFPSDWKDSSEYAGLLELNEVILRACKQDPKERYRSAWEMHGDLMVVVNGDSVKRLRQLERRMAQIKRGAGIAAWVAGIAGLLFYHFFREWQVAAEDRQRQITANITYGNRAVEANDLFAALPYFAEALRLDQGRPQEEKTCRLRLGFTLTQCPKLVQMWFEPMQVSDAEFSPDGRSVLLAQFYGRAEIRDLDSGQLKGHAFGPQFCLHSASYSPDGRYILTASESHVAIVWDATSLMQLLTLQHPNKVYTARFSPDGRRIVTACKDGVARVWEAASGRLEFALPPHSDAVVFAGFSHDGHLLVTASHDGTARVWHEDGQPATVPLFHPKWVNWAEFSADDEQVVTACEDHKARVWDIATARRIMPDLNHNDAVKSSEFSPDGQLILTAGYDGTARLWNAADHQPALPTSVLRQNERVTHASFSPDGRQIVTACTDGSVRLWDLAGAMMPPKAEHRTFCRDGSRYVIITNETFVVCKTEDGGPIGPAFHPAAAVKRVSLSSGGDFIQTSSMQVCLSRTNHLVQAWSSASGKPLGPPILVTSPFTGASLSDNGERCAIYGTEVARLWSTRLGRAISPPLRHTTPITAAVFSPDGALLVTTSGTNAQIWGTETGRLKHRLAAFPAPVSHVEFSRDGRFLVTCCSDPMLTKCSAQVWSVATGELVGGPLRHADGVLSASFNREGTRVVTTSEDFTAKVWDVATGRQLAVPLRHTAQVQAAAFSPDGQWVATASIDHTARIWDVQSGDAITAPLRHLVGLWGVQFLPDVHQLALADGEGNTFDWNLSADTRLPADISEMVEFLSGGSFISPIDQRNGPKQSVRTTWQRLKMNNPLYFFSTSKEEIWRWHEFQAEESESVQAWSAAAFHLKILLRIRPGDDIVAQNLARVNTHMLARSN